MDFDWTEEHRGLHDGAAEFAAERLVDRTAQRDRDGAFSRELWGACAEFGLHGLLIDPEWGGSGLDLLSAVTTLEGIGYGARDNGLVFSVIAHAASCVAPIAESGSDGLKREWLPPGELAVERWQGRPDSTRTLM